MDAPLHACLLTDSVPEARELRLLSLHPPEDLRARLRVPGQYLLAGPPGGPHRSFVICSPVDTTGPWEILVRTGPKVADALASLQPGTSLEISAPRGPGFPMEKVLSYEGEVVLVCAGVAIAALRPVVSAIRARRAGLRGVRLYHGVRTRDHAAFRADVSDWASEGLIDRLCISRGKTEPTDSRGRVQQVLQAETDSPRQALFVAAGPEGLIRDLSSGLPSIGLEAGTVLTNLE